MKTVSDRVVRHLLA